MSSPQTVVTKKEVDNGGDNTIDGWFEYEYDAAGNLIKSVSIVRGLWSEYEYDAFGNRTKEVYYQKDGSISREYKYDSYGNVVYQKEGSLPVFVFTYTYKKSEN